jgi:peptidoglycan/xylan/chitin deacetylase (PgdA/CDA1 family)
MPSIKDFARTTSKSLFALTDLLMARPPGPRLLIYHQVGTFRRRQMEVTESAFRAHLDWLRHNGVIVGLEDALARRGTIDSDRLFVLTFDDGYADLFDFVFPLLEEHGIPFTLYLTTEHVDSGVEMRDGSPPLTWEQVRKMNESGLLTIGAHTHRHIDLRAASLAEIEDDLGFNDQLIEEHLGVVPRHFAYPWGYWSSVADTVVRQRYASATLGAGPPITAGTDSYLVHRVPIQRSDGIFFFRRKVIRGLRLEETTRRLLRGYSGP